MDATYTASFQMARGGKGMILPTPWQDKWPLILFQKRVNKLSD